MMRPKRFLPRVLDVAEPPRYESGDELPSGFMADRVVVMAHYSPDERITRSVRTLSTKLVGHGYHVVIMSTSPAPAPLRWADTPDAPDAPVPAGVSIYRRPNIGYDFGSWAAALHAFGGIAHAGSVILCNDSLIGPFAPISPILDRFESAPGDIWGLLDSTHIAHHVQSYWVGYRGGVLAEAPMRRFWGDIRVEVNKQHIINRYEVGAMRYWRKNGYHVTVGFPFDLVVREGFNPASFGWRRLFDFGFPFVKREIAVNPPPEIVDGDQVAEVVRRRFGEDVAAWV